MSDAFLLVVISYTVVGMAAGLAYFAVLRINLRLYLDGNARWRPLILHGIRTVAAAVLFWVLATRGAAPLLAGLAGFVTARFVAQRWREERP